MIAITISDATRPAATLAEQRLTALGYTVQVFEADGTGGPAMERAILDGTIDAVLDLTPSELVTHHLPDRITAAALKGIPQLIGLGGLNAVESPEVLDAVGKEIAEKASAARGPTRVLVPLRGLNSDAMRALHQSLRNWIYPPELLVEVEAAMGDEAFIESAVAWLARNLRGANPVPPAK